MQIEREHAAAAAVVMAEGRELRRSTRQSRRVYTPIAAVLAPSTAATDGETPVQSSRRTRVMVSPSPVMMMMMMTALTGLQTHQQPPAAQVAAAAATADGAFCS